MYNTDEDFAELLLIPGVGRAKAKALFAAGYRTLAEVSDANPHDLAKLHGINLELARDIVDFGMVMTSGNKTQDKLETPKSLLICPLCGSMVGGDSSACPGCGITFTDEVEEIEPDGDLSVPGEVPERDGYWYKGQSSLFICPECGSLVSDGSKTCPKCSVQFDDGAEEEPGSELPAPAAGDADGYWYRDDSTLFMCPNCGSFIKKDAESCGSCGIVFEAGNDDEEAVAPSSITCPMCKSILPGDADNCPDCGFDFSRERESDGFWYKPQTELFMCPDCGAFIPKSASQCGNCGAVLEEDGVAEPEAPPACPMCKMELKADVDICEGCGFDFAAEKEKDGFWYRKDSVSLFICPGCGAFLSDAAESCLNCGLVFEDQDGVGGEIQPTHAKEMDSELERQVDDLIESVELENGLEMEVKVGEEPAEPVVDVMAQDSMHLCPICGAFVQSSMLRCPSCDLAFDDIEEIELEPVGSVQVENPEELAREMAAEIADIEAELLEPPKPKSDRKGVSKDFLDRWKKLDVDEGSDDIIGTIRRKAAETKSASTQDMDVELELDKIAAFREPTESQKGDHMFWKDRARELASQGKVEEAAAFLDRAVELNPDREMEYKRLMLELMGVGPADRPVDISDMLSIDEIGDLAIDEAMESESNLTKLEEVDAELAADPDNGSLWQEKGELLEKLGRHREAVECFDKSINISYSELKKDSGRGFTRSRQQLGIGLTNGQGRVNGRVNGLLTQRGLVNGSLAGMTNGKVNGMTNGAVRGKINGIGKAPGRINGLRQGRVNGKVNGLTNGLSEGRVNGTGLINGTGVGLINGGLVNGLGLVNGEGMVNGTGSLRRLRHRRRERIMWRYRLTAGVLLVAMILMISMVGNLIVQEEGGRVQIDGNFSDWNQARAYYNFLEGGSQSPGVRILETRMLQESGRLNLFVAFADDAFSGPGVNSVWAFIDVDDSPDTGYSMRGMGIDLALEAYGWNGTVMGANAMRFEPGADADDWNGFTKTGGASAACQGTMLEASINIPREMAPGAENPIVQVISLDDSGNMDVTDYIMARDIAGTVATFTREGGDIIASGSANAPVGVLTLSSHSVVPAAITNLTFDITGTADSGSIRNPVLRTAEGSVLSATYGLSGSSLTFGLSEPLAIELNSTVTLGLEVTVSSAATGKTLGFELAGITLTQEQAVIRNLNARLQNIGTPGAMAVDGAFGDWAAISAIPDRMDDAITANQNASFINRNIDLAETRFSLSQSSLHFFMSVHGTMMGGESIPSTRYRPADSGPSEFTDSDRDSVSDSHDPYPFDFTNDGTPDSEMQTAQGLRDIDGDGIADYPHGPDWWLNTTIPAYFPQPYAGNFVSIYIGPIETQRAEQKGDDRAYVMFDSDGNGNTGLNLKGGFGIDHIIVISGKNNRILAAELYRHDPGNSDTGWTFMGNISAALDWNRMEGAVSMPLLGLGTGDGFTVYTSLEDWKGSVDSADMPYGAEVPAMPATRSTAGDNAVINEVFGFGNVEWVELCNPTPAAMNIGTWTLQIQAGGVGAYKQIYAIPAGTTIGSFGSGSEYLVIALNKQIPDNKFSNLRLVSGTAVVDEVSVPVPTAGTSYARLKNATWGMPTDTDGAGDWYISNSPTMGSPNDRYSPSMTVSKSSDSVIASPGGLVTYTIWYSNTGEGNARHVWINDTLPNGMSYVSSSVPYSSFSGQAYSWHFTHVSPGSYSFSITGQVGISVPENTVLTNTAQIQYTDQLSRPWGTSSSSWDVTVQAPKPVISLTKIADLPNPFPNEVVTFTIGFDNLGTDAAAHAWLNDTLPAGMTFVSASPAPDYQVGQDVRWHFQDVGPGSHSLTVQARVGNSVGSGTVLTNTVTCDYKNSIGTSMPSETASAVMVVENSAASIVINEVATVGSEWIEICNPSTSMVSLNGWQLQYLQGNWRTLYTFLSFESLWPWGSGGEYMVISLAANSIPDASKPLRLTGSGGREIDITTYPGMSSGQSWSRFKHEDTGKPINTGNDADDFYISNNGWIVPDGPTPGAPNDRKRPIMELEKTASPQIAEPGQTVTYTITYRNIGDGNAKDVWVNDTLPAGLDLVSATPTPTAISGQDLTWYFNNIVHGSAGYITITATVNALPADGETVTNSAGLTYHDVLRRPMGTVAATADFTCSRPVIAVAKVADVSAVSPGGTIVYTIYYNNTGSATAGSVWINDTLPTGVSFSSASPAPATISGQDLAWHITNVAPGTHSITVTVTVDGDATGTLVNWAYLDYSSAYGYGLGPSSDSAVVEIPEMRHLAIPILGMMLMGFAYLKRRRQDNGKEI